MELNDKSFFLLKIRINNSTIERMIPTNCATGFTLREGKTILEVGVCLCLCRWEAIQARTLSLH